MAASKKLSFTCAYDSFLLEFYANYNGGINMPVIENVSIADAEKDELIEKFLFTMKARVEDMEKRGKDVPWRKHFRIAMCMCIG